jgi:hypothetical protein
MPRSRKSTSHRGPVRKAVKAVLDAGTKITQTVGSFLFQVSMTADTIASVGVNPTQSFFGTRLNALATVFNNFRFVNLRIIMYPSAQDTCVAYDAVPNASFESATFSNMSQLSKFILSPSSRITNTVFSLNRRALNTLQSNKWWSARTSEDLINLDQGMLMFSSPVTHTATFMIKYAVEFCHPEPPADYVSRGPQPKGMTIKPYILDSTPKPLKINGSKISALPPPPPAPTDDESKDEVTEAGIFPQYSPDPRINELLALIKQRLGGDGLLL